MRPRGPRFACLRQARCVPSGTPRAALRGSQCTVVVQRNRWRRASGSGPTVVLIPLRAERRAPAPRAWRRGQTRPLPPDPAQRSAPVRVGRASLLVRSKLGASIGALAVFLAAQPRAALLEAGRQESAPPLAPAEARVSSLRAGVLADMARITDLWVSISEISAPSGREAARAARVEKEFRAVGLD